MYQLKLNFIFYINQMHIMYFNKSDKSYTMKKKKNTRVDIKKYFNITTTNTADTITFSIPPPSREMIKIFNPQNYCNNADLINYKLPLRHVKFITLDKYRLDILYKMYGVNFVDPSSTIINEYSKIEDNGIVNKYIRFENLYYNIRSDDKDYIFWVELLKLQDIAIEAMNNNIKLNELNELKKK